MATTLESVLSHALPFSKIKQRHFVGHLRYFYLCLQGPWGNGSRERIWKEDLYLMTLRLSFKPCIFPPPFSCSIRDQERKCTRGMVDEAERKRKRRGHWLKHFPVSKERTKNNYLLRFSEPGLETDFSTYKIKKVTQVFVHLQQSSPII